MAKLPVFAGSPKKPLWIDNGFGVMVPAFAEDPCDCCGAAPCACDMSGLTPTIVLPADAVICIGSHNLQFAVFANCGTFGLACDVLANLDCGAAYIPEVGDPCAASIQACIYHDLTNHETQMVIIGFYAWTGIFSDPDGSIYCSGGASGGPYVLPECSSTAGDASWG